MVYIEDILREGLNREASDIHLVKGQKKGKIFVL